ncbi:agmatinase [SAR202 cluster bacterium AD-804-J14_MRT_500m]|nr:agmatinase [SAR202 cluster bacterium AD-804-J14_MRT_500m]
MPVPYDSTTSYRTGTREGPSAILKASYNLEDYDHDLDFDVSNVGIHTTSALEPDMNGPRAMVERVGKAVQQVIGNDKIVGLLGGEHTITIGSIMAMSEKYPDLSVLYLDAHGDLRNQYMGSKWGHATVARRVVEMCPVTQVGLRSISLEEKLSMPCEGLTTFFWKENYTELPSLDELLTSLSEHIYISVDLDVLDPSIMSAVGTPEPGGMRWWQIIELLDVVSHSRKIVGFDITELSPGEGPDACAYLAAKLVYKLIAYSTNHGSNPSTR